MLLHSILHIISLLKGKQVVRVYISTRATFRGKIQTHLYPLECQDISVCSDKIDIKERLGDVGAFIYAIST